MTLLKEYTNTCKLRSYPTPYLAHQAASEQFASPGHMYLPYVCSECHKWHIKEISKDI